MQKASKSKPNHAAVHRDELVAAIETATPAQLREIDADLAREGWTKTGVARSRIADRLADKPTKR